MGAERDEKATMMQQEDTGTSCEHRRGKARLGAAAGLVVVVAVGGLALVVVAAAAAISPSPFLAPVLAQLTPFYLPSSSHRRLGLEQTANVESTEARDDAATVERTSAETVSNNDDDARRHRRLATTAVAREGDICYRFCEDGSEEPVSDIDCEAGLTCTSPPSDMASFDQCGALAFTCQPTAGMAVGMKSADSSSGSSTNMMSATRTDVMITTAALLGVLHLLVCGAFW